MTCWNKPAPCNVVIVDSVACECLNDQSDLVSERYMKNTLMQCTLGLFATSAAMAEFQFDEDGLRGDFGEVQVTGRFSASAQTADIEPLATNGDTSGNAVDGTAAFDVEYTTNNAIVLGLAGEFDSRFDDIEDFERDEIYVYIASDWGRVELGENDGPGDTLSFHAPRVGLGQVRGDFGRYDGTVALLSAYDSRDAAKITYLSAPLGDFRWGISYAPNFDINRRDPDPERRLLQNDVIEIAGQFNTIVDGTTFGASLAYVTGEATGEAGREDIESIGIGIEVGRGPITIGAAFVDRGRSNLLPTSADRSEWNGGISWRDDDWSVAASFARSNEGDRDIMRYGIGGVYEFRRIYYATLDLVFYSEDNVAAVDRDARIAILELGVRFR